MIHKQTLTMRYIPYPTLIFAAKPPHLNFWPPTQTLPLIKVEKKDSEIIVSANFKKIIKKLNHSQVAEALHAIEGAKPLAISIQNGYISPYSDLVLSHLSTKVFKQELLKIFTTLTHRLPILKVWVNPDVEIQVSNMMQGVGINTPGRVHTSHSIALAQPPTYTITSASFTSTAGRHYRVEDDCISGIDARPIEARFADE